MTDIANLLLQAAKALRDYERDGLAAELEAAAESLGEPVAWFTEDHLTDKSATTYSPEVAERWRNKGWPVDALYLAPQPAVPDGWKLVPVKPTDEMIRAAAELPLRALRGWHDRDCYRVMVAAAPEASYE